MKKIRTLLISIFLGGLLLPSAVFAAKEVTTIAVMDFEARGVPKHEAAIIAERFRSQLVKSGLFKVMERGQMENVLKEQGFQQAGFCSDASCVVEVGQLLAVQKVVVGSVGKIGDMYTLNVKLIDVATGEILMTQDEDISGKIEDIILKLAIPKIADKLIQEATAIKLKIGYFNVTSRPSGATVSLDGKECGTSPVKDIEAGAGEHKIKVSLNNHVSQEKTVVIESGKSTDLNFVLTPTEKYLDMERKKTAAKREGLRKLIRWVSGGVAMAGFGAAGYYHLDWDKKYKEYNDTDNRDTASKLHTKITTLEKNRTITAIIGGVGAGGLVITFIF